MKRYIIQNKATRLYLKRTKSGSYTRSSWVVSAGDATLITTASAASQIATAFCNGQSYYKYMGLLGSTPVKVIEVGVLIYPIGAQPFIDGVLNGSK